MVKQGGVSYNPTSDKRGVRENHKCKYCGRDYKMSWAKDRHEKQCYEYNKARGNINK